MAHEIFTYQTHKNGITRIFWEGRCVVTLGGKRGQELAGALADADEKEVQSLLQRAIGNFKRGNERQGRRR
jgi:hypothetical protein